MEIINGDCLEEMRKMEDDSISAVVTDPPYFLTNNCGSGFMGNSWDSTGDLSKCLWESSTFVNFAIVFLNGLSLDRVTGEQSIALGSANTGLPLCEKDQKESACYAHRLSRQKKVQQRDFAPLLVITKEEVWDLLKEMSPTHIKLIEVLQNGEKENALYAIPISSLVKEVRHIAPKAALPLLKADATEAMEIHLTLTEQARIKSVIEATIGTRLDGSFTEEITGSAITALLSAQENKFNAITLRHIEKAELMKWLTSLLCAINAMRESSTIQDYLIQNYFRQIFYEAYRITKPGGHLLAMGGTRTFHRLASAIEASGYEIRDTLAWIYGSGFPKSHNHFGIDGYGTSLKPAHEPIIMAMKKCDGTFKQNAERWGQAGINIDGCRVPSGQDYFQTERFNERITLGGYGSASIASAFKPAKGRWPANIILDKEASALLGEPSRFFYCAKASSSERNDGLEGLPLQEAGIKNDSGRGFSESNPMKSIKYKNNHPTVKPLKLMEYLIKLVMPPKDGILLDPFAGSGTTILAAKRLGFDAIGIEKSAEYCKIARARIGSILV